VNYRAKEKGSFLVAVLAVAAGLSAIGIFQSQTTWKFDAVIIGAFLLGDYPLRWVIGPHKSRRVLQVLQKTYVIPKSHPSPSWAKLALSSCWFLIAVLAVGEVAYLVAFFAGIPYGGKLSSFTIIELSVLLSVLLATDFKDNYTKELGADDFWQNNVP